MNDLDSVVFEEEDEIISSSNTEKEPDVPQNQIPDEEEKDNDLTTEVLRLKGISDPTKIKFEDESGVIVERDWNTLSKEEQLNILIDSENNNNDLDDAEIELINSIRSSGMSIEDFLGTLYKPDNSVKEYKIDSLSDEDVYALDLLEKVGSDNISDEEITAAIEAAKQNETLFKKTVEGLRKEYIRLQEQEEARLEQEQLEQQNQAYQQFSNSIKNEIMNFKQFAGRALDLSNQDMEELSSYILDLDDSGMSNFGKAMNNPTLFTKAAFWLLNEDKIIEELNKQMQDSFKRGYEMAKQSFPKSAPKLVINNSNNKKQINDIYVDDDDWD